MASNGELPACLPLWLSLCAFGSLQRQKNKEQHADSGSDSRTFNCISVVPVANRIVSDLSDGRAGKSASVLLVTIWELGEAAGPLVIAPLSETLGRWPVINVANLLAVLATLLAAVSQTTRLFILARFLSGLVVTANVLNPAIVGDIFDPDRRGSPMSLINVAPLVGGAVGPALGGAIAQTLSWRWTIWISAILTGAGGLLLMVLFRETYKVPILRRRRARQGTMTPDGISFAASEKPGRSELLESISRPFYVFGSSGVLMALALFGSVVFANFYNMATTLPDILQDRYGLSPAQTGSALFCESIGAVTSVVICNVALDRVYARMRASRADGIGQPEFRLPIVIVGGFTLVPAVALYGWSAELRLPLPVMLLSVGLVGMTLMLAFLPLSAYVVDAFGLYSASAMTGLIVARCLMGTFLPLATTPLVERFGYGWGFTVLAAVSLALAPIPVVLLRYGEQWRQGCKYTRDD